jgi:hypothetical protein
MTEEEQEKVNEKVKPILLLLQEQGLIFDFVDLNTAWTMDKKTQEGIEINIYSCLNKGEIVYIFSENDVDKFYEGKRLDYGDNDIF